jgi:hypothetical protein
MTRVSWTPLLIKNQSLTPITSVFTNTLIYIILINDQGLIPITQNTLNPVGRHLSISAITSVVILPLAKSYL